MGELSKIEWCDHTFNPWEGCTKVSPGCAHCYAETRNARFGGGTAPNWGKGAPRRRTSAANWKEPLRWNRASSDGWFRELYDEAGKTVVYRGDLREKECPKIEGERKAIVVRPRVFCASLADWLDDEVPVEWLADLLDLIRLTPHLDWLLLTKRPGNWRKRIGEASEFATKKLYQCHLMLRAWCYGAAPANVWIGTTVEDQTRADERIPLLLSIPAKVRFLSCEPLLGPVDLITWGDDAKNGTSHFCTVANGIHWVICGGESGPGARSMNLAWAESLREQCASAGVPFFMKQLGAAPELFPGQIYRTTDKKGNLMAEWPAALRVRQFPEVSDV